MKPTIHLLSSDTSIETDAGISLMEALARKRILLRADCGGKGTCGKCRVHIENETGKMAPVKACTHMVTRDISVEIPESAMLSSHVMTKAHLAFPAGFKAGALKDSNKKRFGIAVDLGTTTIGIYLCEIFSRTVIGSLAVKNPQAPYGDDVISRISFISTTDNGLGRLQQLVVRAVEWGSSRLLKASGISPDAVEKITAVGNPAMIHILAGEDPAPIGMAPYHPRFYEARQLEPHRTGLQLANLCIHTLPNCSGFIGGDILAAALAAELDRRPRGTLLVDLGTNGELLLSHNGRLFAASCATGPAFEGAALSCGMQAVPGAVNRVRLTGGQDLPEVSVIPSPGHKATAATGICGAGVISTVAQMLRHGIIRPDGALVTGKKYVLVPKDPSSGQAEISISQKDIRGVQLGKSALSTGIQFLLKAAGLDRPERIIIAGAFGSHLDKTDMAFLGMIPGLNGHAVTASGNAAGSGAVMALCDDRLTDTAAQMADAIETIELATNLEFQDQFIRNLEFAPPPA